MFITSYSISMMMMMMKGIVVALMLTYESQARGECVEGNEPLCSCGLGTSSVSQQAEQGGIRK